MEIFDYSLLWDNNLAAIEEPHVYLDDVMAGDYIILLGVTTGQVDVDTVLKSQFETLGLVLDSALQDTLVAGLEAGQVQTQAQDAQLASIVATYNGLRLSLRADAADMLIENDEIPFAMNKPGINLVTYSPSIKRAVDSIVIEVATGTLRRGQCAGNMQS